MLAHGLATLRARLALPPALRRPVVALGFTQIVGWGTTFYAPAVLGPAIVAETGWSRTQVFGAFSLSLILGAVIARPVGRVFDRGSGRVAMAAGSALAAAGLLLAAVATSFAAYVAAWAVLGVAMRFMLYEAAFATLAAASGQAARRAISVLTLYGGFASTVFWPIGAVLLEAFGWRATLVIFAGCNLLLCLPVHALALPRRDAPLAPAPENDAPLPTEEAVLTGADRRLTLWVLTAAFALFMYVNSALSAHLIEFMVAFGLSATAAVTAASLRGLGQFIGRLWQIVFAAAIAPFALCLVAIGLTPVAMLVLATGAGAGAAIAFCVLQGASNGLITIARGVAPLRLFGAAGYGALMGTMSGPALVVSALAPALHAAIVDAAGHAVAIAVGGGAVAIAFGMVAALAWRLRGR